DVVDFAAAAREGRQVSEDYKLASPDVAHWDFTADEKGTTALETFSFRFPKRLEAAPGRLSAVLSFLTRYRVICPPGSAKLCRSFEKSGDFGTPLRGDVPQVVVRCLVITAGPAGHGFFIGVNSDCGGFEGKNYRTVPSHQ
ncbi:MAG TPA: hypothetical protein VEZ11_01665, partial [Thermoanaerobaculia bacterium]|nr:hypothetical protein [Thermoanaerobaculia bacterium]